jgi:hypothetical protein
MMGLRRCDESNTEMNSPVDSDNEEEEKSSSSSDGGGGGEIREESEEDDEGDAFEKRQGAF